MSKLVRRHESLPVHVLQDRVVQRLMAAEEALAYAVGVDQVKLVMDVAAAQEVFANRQKLGEDVIGFAHAIKVRALARLGELIKQIDLDRGGGTGSNQHKRAANAARVSAATKLADLGISPKVSAVAQQLASFPSEAREAIAQREKTLAEVRRERKAVEIRRTVDLPDAKYRVIYADPPWSYNDKADDGGVQVSGGVELHYPTMKIAELCALGVQQLCEPNAVLFLWVTSPLLFEAAAVIKAWGFAYKASFVWDKVKHNMGHYNSVRHEFLLICTRGSCTPDVVELFDSVQSIEKTTHSTKPEKFRGIIDTLYPHGKRLELFARRPAGENWACWGNEVSAQASA